MRRTSTFTLAILLVTSLFLSQCQTIVKGETEDSYYSIKSKVTYVNPADGSRIWNLTEDDQTIGLFMNNSWQSVELKSNTDRLKTVKADEDGNKIGIQEFSKQQLSPGENVSSTVEYQVIVKPRTVANVSEGESSSVDAIPRHLAQQYVGAEGPWLINDPELVKLAHDIAGDETNALTLVKEAVNWIKDNIAYGTHEVPLYPNQTLNARVGDCDDQAILLVTLLRILGIPSYVQIGAIYLPQNMEVSQSHWNDHVRIVQRKIGWHGWAMVYVPPWGWLPVDLTSVPRGLQDPLNAIRYGAVIEYNAVQYMNVSKVDYVAESLQAKSFLIENGFMVHVEDQMIEVSQNGVRGLNVTVTTVLIALMTIAIALSTFFIMRHRHERLEQKGLGDK